jgi:hypothetical protein
VVGVFVLATVSLVVLARDGVLGGSGGSTGARGSGVAASQTRVLAPFRRVDLAGSNNVTIRVGGRQSVVVHADDNLLRRITTVVREGTLVIGNTPGSFSATSPMSVEIRVPSLSVLKLSGSGGIDAEGVRSSNLIVSLSGSGVLRAAGRAANLDVRLGGSGDIQLDRLAARDALAVMSGSGRILVLATNRLDASVSGSGSIVYIGHPTYLTKSVTGSGAVIRGDAPLDART